MDHVKLDKLFPNIAHETRGHYIGDVDPVKFMHEFLPWNIDDSGPFKKFKAQKPSKKQITALKSMATKSGESDMNRACVSSTNHILNRIILTSFSARRSSWLAQGASRTISYYRLRRHPQLSRLFQRPWHRRSSLQQTETVDPSQNDDQSRLCEYAQLLRTQARSPPRRIR